MIFTKYFKESKITTVIGIVSVLVLMANIYYPKYFPVIHSEIFVLLVQLNSTILGFSLVGLFFFIGKFDDMKKEIVSLWFEAVNIRSDFLDEQNKLTDIVLDFINKAAMGRTPIFSTFVNRLTEVKSKNIANIDSLRSQSPVLTESFREIDNWVEKNFKFIVSYFGIGIFFSLVGLFLMWNNLNQFSWTVLILSVSFTMDAISHYYYSWKNMRIVRSNYDNLRIMLEQTNYIYKKARTHS